MSITEIAVSQMGSINARQSECVNLDPFEEEKSADWNEPQPEPTPQPLAVQRTCIPITEPLPKEKFSIKSERKSYLIKDDDLSSTNNKEDNYRLPTGSRLNIVEINNDAAGDYCLELEQDSLRPKQVTDRGPSSKSNAKSYGTGSENYDKVATDPHSSVHSDQKMPSFKPFASQGALTESQPEEGSQNEL